MLEKEHKNLDPGELKCLEKYMKEVEGQPVRKNLLRMITHVNFLNPLPTKDSWEYIFWNRMLTDEMVDFVNKMKLRHPYYIDDLAKVQGMSVEDCAKPKVVVLPLPGEDIIFRKNVPFFLSSCLSASASLLLSAKTFSLISIILYALSSIGLSPPFV